MSIYCVYLTVYRGNKLPPFYIGKTTTANISAGYRGSVSSKQYKSIWVDELVNSPNLFTTKIIKTFTNRIDSSEYELSLLRHFNAHKNPMYINMNIGGVSFNLDESIQNKTHHFFDSEFQTWVNRKRVAEKTSHFIDPEFQREMARRSLLKHTPENRSDVAKRSNSNRVSNGTHNFLNNGDSMSKEIAMKNSRENVSILRTLALKRGVKLGRNWYRKSNEWIDQKILELS